MITTNTDWYNKASETEDTETYIQCMENYEKNNSLDEVLTNLWEE